MKNKLINILFLVLILVTLITITSCNKSNGELSESEQKIYNLLKENNDTTYLKELSPISIAKLYFQAQLNKDYDILFNLCIKDNSTIITVSTSEYEKVYQNKDISFDNLYEIINSIYIEEDISETIKVISNSKFTSTNNNLGYIKYKTNLNNSEEVIIKLLFMEKDISLDVWKIDLASIQANIDFQNTIKPFNVYTPSFSIILFICSLFFILIGFLNFFMPERSWNIYHKRYVENGKPSDFAISEIKTKGIFYLVVAFFTLLESFSLVSIILNYFGLLEGFVDILRKIKF